MKHYFRNISKQQCLMLLVALFVFTGIVSAQKTEPEQATPPKEAAKQAPAQEVVATVNNDTIYLDEVESMAGRLGSDSQIDPNSPEGKRVIIDNLINQRLLMAEAEKVGITKRPEIISRIQSAKEQIIINQLIQEHFGKELEVKDEEITAYYEKNKAELVVPERRHVRNIVVKEEAEAKKAKERLAKKEDFTKLVEELSLPDWKSNGGDLGFIEKQRIIPEFADAVFALKPHVFSDPIKTQHGFHIVEVIEIQEARPMKLEEVKDDIKRLLTQQKHDALVAKWVEELRTGADISIKGSKLSQSKNYQLNNVKIEPVAADQPKTEPNAEPEKGK